MSRTLSIGELARRMRLRPSAIRYYESEGLLEPAPRRNGRRVYDEDVCDRLALVQLARRAGFTIQEIHALFHGFPDETGAVDRWRGLVGDKKREIAGKLDELRRMNDVLERCRCPDLDACGAVARSRRS